MACVMLKIQTLWKGGTLSSDLWMHLVLFGGFQDCGSYDRKAWNFRAESKTLFFFLPSVPTVTGGLFIAMAAAGTRFHLHTYNNRGALMDVTKQN